MIDDYITADGIVFEVRRSSRRQRVVLGFDGEGKCYVAAPLGIPYSELVSIVRRNSAKLTDKLAKRRASYAMAHEYKDGELFCFRGQQYPLRIYKDALGNGILFSNGEFVTPTFASVDEIRSRFEKWYSHRLTELLKEEFPAWCKRIGAGPKRVTVKNVKSLWGSCSSRRNITFNIQLALVPPRLMEYVMIHELCHLFEMNHSARFWSRVGTYCADYMARRAELKRDGIKYRW